MGIDMSKSQTVTRTDTSCPAAGIYRSDCADQERVTWLPGILSQRVQAAGKPSDGIWSWLREFSHGPGPL